MDHISVISEILGQEDDILAQRIEHWISNPVRMGSNPIMDVGFFQTMHHFLVTHFHFRKHRLYSLMLC